MSHIWTFSQESNELLQKCLAAAGPPDESNKFMQKFGPKNLCLIKKVENSITIEDSPEMDIDLVPHDDQEDDISKALEEFTDPDVDLLSKFDQLQIKCTQNTKLLIKLSEIISYNTKEKLIQHIFNSKDIDNQFLELFFQYFLPAHIKKDNSRACTDLLLKTYKLYSKHFNILLKVVLKDLEIQNSIINDLILTLNSMELTEFLNQTCNIELTSQEFVHNLFNIYTAYKTCNKTDKVQNLIFNLLKTHSQCCTTDKNYGKLFLAYLQQEKYNNREIDTLTIQGILDLHESPFKRPCLAILKEINCS